MIQKCYACDQMVVKRQDREARMTLESGIVRSKSTGTKGRHSRLHNSTRQRSGEKIESVNLLEASIQLHPPAAPSSGRPLVDHWVYVAERADPWRKMGVPKTVARTRGGKQCVKSPGFFSLHKMNTHEKKTEKNTLIKENNVSKIIYSLLLRRDLII